MQKSIVFPYSSNKNAESKINKTIAFTMALKDEIDINLILKKPIKPELCKPQNIAKYNKRR